MKKFNLYYISIDYIKYLYQYENGNNKFLKNICCNFKKLEEKLQEYGGD